ncbi:transmembrane protein 26-like isoform X3 [Nelusetta ayraudi]|uniref:transmembrane protein 26-like isoform X3 n=1 Tax=Nelusetta ayraudi TaxID=303726 RepID=UPI003F7249F7
MFLFEFIRALVTRGLFLVVALLGIWRVTWVKKDPYYWYLIVLFLPLLVEMVLTLENRKGQDYKWISPPIFLFLTSIIPSIWILEIHQSRYKSNNPQCIRFDSWENMQRFVNRTTVVYEQNDDYLKMFQNVFTSICPNVWILAFHQVILILLIVGKWLLPLGGGVTREELSQLLISFVGTAADILEFTSETLSDIKGKSPMLVYIILSVWTWSMLQFPLHLSVVTTKTQDENDAEVQPMTLCAKHSTDIFAIMESTLTQDGPFLVVRATVIIYYKVFHQMLVFFAIKNILVVLLSMYRMYVICRDFNPPEVPTDQVQSPAAEVEAPRQPSESQPPDEQPGPSHLATTPHQVQPGSASATRQPRKAKSDSRTVSKATRDPKTVSKAKSDSRTISKVTRDPTSISTATPDPKTVPKITKHPKTVAKATKHPRTTSKATPDSTTITKAKSDPKRASKATQEPRTVPEASPDPSTIAKATKGPRKVTKAKSDPRAVSKATPDSTKITKAKSDHGTVSKAKAGRKNSSKAKPGPSKVSEAAPGPSSVSVTMPDSDPTTSEIEEGNG